MDRSGVALRFLLQRAPVSQRVRAWRKKEEVLDTRKLSHASRGVSFERAEQSRYDKRQSKGRRRWRTPWRRGKGTQAKGSQALRVFAGRTSEDAAKKATGENTTSGEKDRRRASDAARHQALHGGAGFGNQSRRGERHRTSGREMVCLFLSLSISLSLSLSRCVVRASIGPRAEGRQPVAMAVVSMARGPV